MSSNAVSIVWGMPTVANTDAVEAKHWQSIAAHCDYLAAVRHLQQPVMIGRAFNDDWANDTMGGQARITMRIPAFTSWVMPGQFASLNDTEFANTPQVSFGLSMTNNITAAPLSKSYVVGAKGSAIANAEWNFPSLMMQDDSSSDGDSFPLKTTFDEAQSTSVAITIYIDDNCYVHAIQLQSQVAENASLII